MPGICESAVNMHVSAVKKRDFVTPVLGTVDAFFFRDLGLAF